MTIIVSFQKRVVVASLIAIPYHHPRLRQRPPHVIPLITPLAFTRLTSTTRKLDNGGGKRLTYCNLPPPLRASSHGVPPRHARKLKPSRLSRLALFPAPLRRWASQAALQLGAFVLPASQDADSGVPCAAVYPPSGAPGPLCPCQCPQVHA